MTALMLKPADVVCVRGPHWMSRAIRWRTRSRGEEPSVINHVGLVVSTGTLRTALVVEALLGGAVRRTLDAAYAGSGDEIAIFRPLNLSTAERTRIAAAGDRYVGRRYGVTKIALHLLGLRGLAFVDGWPICSWAVTRPYCEEGYTFGVDSRIADPDDVWDFCVGRPEKYECVRELAVID